MDRLIPLIQSFNLAPDLKRKLRLAEEILSIVGPKLRLAVIQVPTFQDAEDIYQEALVGITTNLILFNGNTDWQFWSWCHRIARNKVADFWRKKGRDPVETLDTKELWKLVENSTESRELSPGDRIDFEYALDLIRRAQASCVDYLWERYVLGFDFQDHGRYSWNDTRSASEGNLKVLDARCKKAERKIRRMPSENSNADESKLQKLGELLRQGVAKLPPLTEKQLVSVRNAVQEQWERAEELKEQQQKETSSSAEKQKLKEKQAQQKNPQSNDQGQSH